MMGLESLGPWESGRCVSLWPGVGSETMGARTGSPCRRDHYRAGGGSSRGEGMGERLRCQTPSTTSTPPPPSMVLFLNPKSADHPCLPSGKRLATVAGLHRHQPWLHCHIDQASGQRVTTVMRTGNCLHHDNEEGRVLISGASRDRKGKRRWSCSMDGHESWNREEREGKQRGRQEERQREDKFLFHCISLIQPRTHHITDKALTDISSHCVFGCMNMCFSRRLNCLRDTQLQQSVLCKHAWVCLCRWDDVVHHPALDCTRHVWYWAHVCTIFTNTNHSLLCKCIHLRLL